MADEIKKKNTANIYNPFGLGRINRSCMFKRCIEIYPCACTSDKVILKERFVLFYCSYLLNIFILNVFCTISINHVVALCKNSVNDLCKIMLSLYTFVQILYVTPWLSTFFIRLLNVTPPHEESMRYRYLSCVSSIFIFFTRFNTVL